MLQLLGSQLRESVRWGRTDPHVLAAAEWALDRHRARAIRLMAAGFGEDDSLDDRLRELVRQSRQAERRGTNGVPKRADLRRLMRLLQTISGEQLRGQTASLLQRLDRPVEIHNAECEAPGLHRGNEVSAS